MNPLDPSKTAAMCLAVLLAGGLLTINPATMSLEIFDDADDLPPGALNCLSGIPQCYEADSDGIEAVVGLIHTSANQAMPDLGALEQHLRVLSANSDQGAAFLRLLDQLPPLLAFVGALPTRVTVVNASTEIDVVHKEFSLVCPPFFVALHSLLAAVDEASAAHVQRYLPKATPIL